MCRVFNKKNLYEYIFRVPRTNVALTSGQSLVWQGNEFQSSLYVTHLGLRSVGPMFTLCWAPAGTAGSRGAAPGARWAAPSW